MSAGAKCDNTACEWRTRVSVLQAWDCLALVNTQHTYGWLEGPAEFRGMHFESNM